MKERCFYCKHFFKDLSLDNLLNKYYVYVCNDCIIRREIYIKNFIKKEKRLPTKFNLK